MECARLLIFSLLVSVASLLNVESRGVGFSQGIGEWGSRGVWESGRNH